ncbi:hypothetical protein TSA6c_17435 [Azospirillum sp. TSA6c]|nr:hypothetical protein TSA6c_17435 [Azospirillum sp. TSA6c]
MMRKPPTPAQLRREVDAFNKKVKVGDQVTVKKDDGTVVVTVTRGLAFVLSGHSAVVSLEGISGCYLLNRVTPGAPKVLAVPASTEAA